MKRRKSASRPKRAKSPGVKRKTTPRAAKKARKDATRYPKGWDRERVQAVMDHYDNQADEEAAAEDDAARRSSGFTMMAIPVELVAAVQKLIARHAG